MEVLKDISQCTGCTACEQSCPKHAIYMEEDSRGFVYPVIQSIECIECGKCQMICPINTIPKVSSNSKCYGALNKSEEQRLNSSSGGIFMLLASEILSIGGVIYGAAYNEFNEVIHIEVDDMESLKRLQGAKYSQSTLVDIFFSVKSNLLNDKMVLFSGTSCQVAGLKNYLGREYSKLIVIDFVCHGVPSPKAWREYVEYRSVEDGHEGENLTINLRSKSTGWSRYRYSVLFQYASGDQYTVLNGMDSYMKAFVNNLILRASCNDCQFKGVHRCSDITLGDFWGVWNIKPELDDDKGTSLVIIHSKKGQSIWNDVKEKCVWTELTETEAYKENQSLIRSSLVNPKAKELIKKIDKNGYKDFYSEIEKYGEAECKVERRTVLLRRIVGKLKRILFSSSK